MLLALQSFNLTLSPTTRIALLLVGLIVLFLTVAFVATAAQGGDLVYIARAFRPMGGCTTKGCTL